MVSLRRIMSDNKSVWDPELFIIFVDRCVDVTKDIMSSDNHVGYACIEGAVRKSI